MVQPVLRVVRGVRQRALTGDAAGALKARLLAVCREVPGGDALCGVIVAEIDRETTPQDRWDFDMVNFAQQAVALRLMRLHAKRLRVSLAVWEDITSHLDKGSGIVLGTLPEIAQRSGQPMNHVSAALMELVRWNVLLRFKSGRSVLWKMNANIATRLPAAAGEVARKSDGPVLVASDGELVDATS